MSAGTRFFFFIFGCILGLQLAQTAFVTTTPSHLLSYYPYRSHLGFPRPSYLSDATNLELEAMARQYGLSMNDLYQWYTLINTYAHLPPGQDIALMRQLADIYNRELYYRGWNYYHGYGHYNGYGYPGAYSSIAATTPLVKREPQLIPSIMNDISSNISSAYNNVVNDMYYYMPETTSSMRNLVRDTVGTNVPRAAAAEAEDLSNRMTSNMRSMMSDVMGTMSRYI